MATVQGIYLALFGRPADPLGLSFFNSVTNNGQNLAGIGPLQTSAEYQARFAGQTNTQIITSIYQSLFNRDPDLAGLTFFANALATGSLSINNIAIAIYDGAQGADITIRNLKEAAANAFTAAIDTVAEINGYSGTAAADSGRAFIAGVTTTAPTADQVAAAVATATTQVNPGNLIALTTGADNLTGTGGNDTFNGLSDTLANGGTYSVADRINGGAGNDTLNVTVVGAAGAAIVSNVEVINVRSTAGVTFDASSITGATQFWSDNSTAAATIQNIQNTATLGVRGGNGTTAVSFTYKDTLIPSAATAGTQNIAMNAADITTLSIGTATVGGNEFTTLAFDVTGANRIRTALNDSNAGALDAYETVTVKGAGSLRIDAALSASTKSVDASANAGGVRLDLSATAATKFVGSTGNDRVNLAASLATGDDIDGGAGTDTVAISDADTLTATTGPLLKNFETLEITAGDATAYAVNRVAGATAVTISTVGAGDTVTTSGQKVAQTTTVTADGSATSNVTLAFSDAGVGGTDAHTIVLSNSADFATGVDLGTVVAGNIDALTINSIGSPGVAAKAASIAALTGNTDLNTLTITGDTDLEITAVGALAADTYSAATFTGSLSLGAMANTAAAVITGGTKADVILASTNGDVLSGGAGGDKLSGGAGADTISGGEGNDLIYTGALTVNTVAGLAAETYAAPGGAAAADGAVDRIVFNTALNATTNVDKVVVFVTGSDKIVLDDAIFTGLGTGTGSETAGGAALVRYGEGASLAAAVTASGLVSGSAILAVDNGANTDVFFMADVTAATSTAVQFSQLVGINVAALAAGDFLVI